MDTHSFSPLFRWLQQHGYCTVQRTTVTKVVKGRTRKFSRKIVEITEAGKAVVPPLRKLPRLGDLKEIASRFNDARSAEKQADILQELIVEAFDIAYMEFYGAARTEGYEWFRGELEERIRKHLDEGVTKYLDERMREHLDGEIGPVQGGFVHDVYLVIKRIQHTTLLKDAKLAREGGHFLTQNHRYILRKIEHIKEKDLLDHNVCWSKNVMSFKPSGDELSQELMHRIEPWRIVEREWRERGAHPTLGPETVTWARNSYDFDDRWNPDVKELVTRWNQTRKRRIIGRSE